MFRKTFLSQPLQKRHSVKDAKTRYSKSLNVSLMQIRVKMPADGSTLYDITKGSERSKSYDEIFFNLSSSELKGNKT